MIIFKKEIGLVLLLIFMLSFCTSPPEGVIILCAGDSITEAAYPKFLRQILKSEGIRAKIFNQGKSGYNTREYLEFLKKNHAALTKTYPDFVLLQLGTNDVRIDNDQTSADEFYQNMNSIIVLFGQLKIRSGKKTQILLATIPPIHQDIPFPFAPESGKRVEEEINPLIKKIAGEQKIPLVDNHSLFLRSPHLLPDVHPSEQGYQALAQNWFKALKKEGI